VLIRRALSASHPLIGAAVLQIVLAFAGNLVILRSLAPDEFGRFAVSLAGISLIAGLLSLRLGIIIMRTPDVAFTPERQQVYFSALVLETLVIAALSAIWLTVSDYRSGLDFLLLFAVAVQHFCSHVRAYWERQMPYRSLAAIETASVAMGQAVGVGVILSTGNSAALYFREAAAALTLLAGLWLARGLALYPFAWLDLTAWRALLREARGVWLDSVLEAIFQRVTILIAAMVGGHAGAGLFAMAQRLAVLPHQTLSPVARVALNWFGRTDHAQDRRQGRDRLMMMVAIPLVLCALVSWQIADPLVPWLFGEHWRGAVPALIAMSGVVVFTSVFEITRGYALVTRHSAILLAGRIAQFVGFLLPLVFVSQEPARAAQGLGLGLSLAFVFAAVIQIALLRRTETR